MPFVDQGQRRSLMCGVDVCAVPTTKGPDRQSSFAAHVHLDSPGEIDGEKGIGPESEPCTRLGLQSELQGWSYVTKLRIYKSCPSLHLTFDATHESTPQNGTLMCSILCIILLLQFPFSASDRPVSTYRSRLA
jgi:hypothetical protein